MKIKLANFFGARFTIGTAAFLFGVLLILGIRVAAYTPPKEVHYHANFAVYINGQREEFKALNYYEETVATSCSAPEEDEDTPMSRVHMHGGVNSVVHVEDNRVTWGNFFGVLGWNAGENYLATRDAVYQTNGQATLTYMLNGKAMQSIANVTIGDQDKLLVNYGDQSPDQIAQEYQQIQNNALKADQSKDPAACGSHAMQATMRERMKHMF